MDDVDTLSAGITAAGTAAAAMERAIVAVKASASATKLEIERAAAEAAVAAAAALAKKLAALRADKKSRLKLLRDKLREYHVTAMQLSATRAVLAAEGGGGGAGVPASAKSRVLHLAGSIASEGGSMRLPCSTKFVDGPEEAEIDRLELVLHPLYSNVCRAEGREKDTGFLVPMRTVGEGRGGKFAVEPFTEAPWLSLQLPGCAVGLVQALCADCYEPKNVAVIWRSDLIQVSPAPSVDGGSMQRVPMNKQLSDDDSDEEFETLKVLAVWPETEEVVMEDLDTHNFRFASLKKDSLPIADGITNAYVAAVNRSRGSLFAVSTNSSELFEIEATKDRTMRSTGICLIKGYLRSFAVEGDAFAYVQEEFKPQRRVCFGNIFNPAKTERKTMAKTCTFVANGLLLLLGPGFASLETENGQLDWKPISGRDPSVVFVSGAVVLIKVRKPRLACFALLVKAKKILVINLDCLYDPRNMPDKLFMFQSHWFSVRRNEYGRDAWVCLRERKKVWRPDGTTLEWPLSIP